MAKFSAVLAVLVACGGTAICQTSKPAGSPASRPATGPASAPAGGTGTIIGKVVDANGTPVEGANVSVCVLGASGPDANSQMLARTKSGKDGAFTIEGLAPGTQRTLWVRRPSPGRVILSADVNDLKIEAGKTLDVGAVKVAPVQLKFEARPL